MIHGETMVRSSISHVPDCPVLTSDDIGVLQMYEKYPKELQMSRNVDKLSTYTNSGYQAPPLIREPGYKAKVRR